MTSFHSFKVGADYLSRLSKNEKELLPLLTEAVKVADKIFHLQENDMNNGANFYPRDAIKEEIEDQALNDPKILSPFTVVERDEKGNLKAVDYHIKYKKPLKEIAKLLTDAAKICENKSFKNYLATLAESLLNGDYEQVDKAWLSVHNSNIDLVIGPYERYIDKMFFMKRAFQGYVGIIDRERTREARLIRDILYTTVGSRPLRIVPPSIVDVHVNNALSISGLLGKMFLAQQHLPSDTDSVEKYGSRIIGFETSIDYKFDKLIYPIFIALFEKTFRSRYTKEILRKGNYYFILLQAIAQHLHRYRGSRQRLRELFPIFDEANSVATGIQHAKHLVLKGVMDQKELEAAMISYICWIFSEWILSKKSSIRDSYLKGDALILNFMIKEGTIQEKDGLSWPNFAKMFFEIENLASIFTRILETGTSVEAQEFLSKYLSLEPFKAFEKSLRKIKPL